MVVASAVNADGEELYPRKWNPEFMDMPEVRNQHTPALTSEQVNAILKAASGQERVLYAVLAGSGLRIGEALGLEIGKHVSADCSTLSIKQSVWNGKVQTPKTQNAFREVALAPPLAALLKEHIGDRASGFVFQYRNGLPIVSQSSILKRNLHPILNKANFPKVGFHSFRRFRVTWLRKNRVPEDLTRFWIGHAEKTVTDSYSKLSEDEVFRKQCSQEIGLGFEIPPSEPANCTNDTKTEVGDQVAQSV
jgi:integrase